MGFGAFAPLPIRLGADDGVTAADWLRASADVAAMKHAAPLLACIVELSAGGASATVYDVLTRDPAKATPAVTPLPYGFTLRLPDYLDDAGVSHVVAPRRALAWVENAGVTAHPSVTGYDVTVALTSVASASYTYVVVFGDDDAIEGDPSPAGYGAISEKTDVRGSAATPRAWQWWRTLKSLRGVGAYTQEVVSQVGIRDLAFARHLSWIGSLADRLVAEQLPETSSSRLGYWATVLGIEQRRNTEARARDLCAARYQARQGPTADVIDAVCARVFGTAFVRTWRSRDAIDIEPAPTYWPGGVIGPASLAIDAVVGPWLSARSRLDVEVTRPANLSDGEWLDVTRDFTVQLDRILPAWVVFDWATELTGGGFILDETPLDEGGLG